MKFEKFYSECTEKRIANFVEDTDINSRDSIINTIEAIKMEIRCQLDRADNKVDFEALEKLNVLYASYSILLK